MLLLKGHSQLLQISYKATLHCCIWLITGSFYALSHTIHLQKNPISDTANLSSFPWIIAEHCRRLHQSYYTWISTVPLLIFLWIIIKKNSTSLLRAGEGPRRWWDYGYECPLLTSFNPQADPLTDSQCCGSLAVISLAVIGGNCKKLLPRWRLKTYQVILLLLNFLAK